MKDNTMMKTGRTKMTTPLNSTAVQWSVILDAAGDGKCPLTAWSPELATWTTVQVIPEEQRFGERALDWGSLLRGETEDLFPIFRDGLRYVFPTDELEEALANFEFASGMSGKRNTYQALNKYFGSLFSSRSTVVGTRKGLHIYYLPPQMTAAYDGVHWVPERVAKEVGWTGAGIRRILVREGLIKGMIIVLPNRYFPADALVVTSEVKPHIRLSESRATEALFFQPGHDAETKETKAAGLQGHIFSMWDNCLGEVQAAQVEKSYEATASRLDEVIAKACNLDQLVEAETAEEELSFTAQVATAFRLFGIQPTISRTVTKSFAETLARMYNPYMLKFVPKKIKEPGLKAVATELKVYPMTFPWYGLQAVAMENPEKYSQEQLQELAKLSSQLGGLAIRQEVEVRNVGKVNALVGICTELLPQFGMAEHLTVMGRTPAGPQSFAEVMLKDPGAVEGACELVPAIRGMEGELMIWFVPGHETSTFYLNQEGGDQDDSFSVRMDSEVVQASLEGLARKREFLDPTKDEAAINAFVAEMVRFLRSEAVSDFVKTVKNPFLADLMKQVAGKMRPEGSPETTEILAGETNLWRFKKAAEIQNRQEAWRPNTGLIAKAHQWAAGLAIGAIELPQSVCYDMQTKAYDPDFVRIMAKAIMTRSNVSDAVDAVSKGINYEEAYASESLVRAAQALVTLRLIAFADRKGRQELPGIAEFWLCAGPDTQKLFFPAVAGITPTFKLVRPESAISFDKAHAGHNKLAELVAAKASEDFLSSDILRDMLEQRLSMADALQFATTPAGEQQNVVAWAASAWHRVQAKPFKYALTSIETAEDGRKVSVHKALTAARSKASSDLWAAFGEWKAKRLRSRHEVLLRAKECRVPSAMSIFEFGEAAEAGARTPETKAARLELAMLGLIYHLVWKTKSPDCVTVQYSQKWNIATFEVEGGLPTVATMMSGEVIVGDEKWEYVGPGTALVSYLNSDRAVLDYQKTFVSSTSLFLVATPEAFEAVAEGVSSTLQGSLEEIVAAADKKVEGILDLREPTSGAPAFRLLNRNDNWVKCDLSNAETSLPVADLHYVQRKAALAAANAALEGNAGDRALLKEAVLWGGGSKALLDVLRGDKDAAKAIGRKSRATVLLELEKLELKTRLLKSLASRKIEKLVLHDHGPASSHSRVTRLVVEVVLAAPKPPAEKVEDSQLELPLSQALETVYQGRNGHEDGRQFQYWAASYEEAKGYGRIVDLAEVSVSGMLNVRTEKGREIYNAAKVKHGKETGYLFDILDNRTADHVFFFQRLLSMGYNGLNLLGGEDNKYVVTLGNEVIFGRKTISPVPPVPPVPTMTTGTKTVESKDLKSKLNTLFKREKAGAEAPEAVPTLAAAEKPIYKIAFTGHRPQKLPAGAGRVALQEAISAALQRASAKYAETHQLVVISGGAEGVDTDAAREAAKLGIPYIVAVPFKGQSSKWSPDAQATYEKMCKLADSKFAQLLGKDCARVEGGTVILDEGGYEYAKYGKRDRWMVDHCDALIAVYDGSPSGTGRTYDYAKSVGKPIVRINPNDFRNPQDANALKLAQEK
jgi:uncharacterized phage-like protein YoqJ